MLLRILCSLILSLVVDGVEWLESKPDKPVVFRHEVADFVEVFSTHQNRRESKADALRLAELCDLLAVEVAQPIVGEARRDRHAVDLRQQLLVREGWPVGRYSIGPAVGLFLKLRLGFVEQALTPERQKEWAEAYLEMAETLRQTAGEL